jgi:hypothetical protein
MDNTVEITERAARNVAVALYRSGGSDAALPIEDLIEQVEDREISQWLQRVAFHLRALTKDDETAA